MNKLYHPRQSLVHPQAALVHPQAGLYWPTAASVLDEDPELQAEGAAIGVFSAANYWVGTAGVGPDFEVGRTFIILLWVTGHANNQVVWCYNASTTSGWRLTHSAGGTLNLIFGAGSPQTFQSSTDMKLGLNCYAVQRLQGGSLRSSMNGGAVIQLHAAPTYNTAAGTALHAYGRSVSPSQNATQSRVLGVAILDRASGDYTDAELQKFAGSVNNLNRWHLHPDILADANLLHCQQAPDWDGSAATFTATGSAPYTLTKQGTGGGKVTMPAMLRYVIPPRAVHDNARWEHPGGDEPSGVHNWNIYGRAVFTSSTADSGGAAGLVVEANKSIDVGALEQKDVGVRVDGALVTGNEENALEIQDDNIIRCLDCTGIGAGADKTFNVIAGARRWPGDYGDAYPIKGITPTAVRVLATAPLTWVAKTAPAHRLIIVSDNHAVELEDNATNITSSACYLSWPMLVRANSTYGVAVDAWESRSIFTATLDRFGGQGAVMSTFDNIVALADGTASNTLIFDLGVTDYNHDLYEDIPLLKTGLGNFLDDLHAELPDLIIYVTNSTPAAFGAADNAKGWNMADLRTALEEVCDTRAWATYVDGSGWVTGAGIGASGNYFTVAGHAQAEVGVRAVLGY